MDSGVLDYYDGRERSLPYLSLPYGVSRREYPRDMSGGHPGFQFAYNTPILTPQMWDAYSAWARGQGLDAVEDAHDYDMQGAFLREFAMPLDARVAEAVDPRGHGSDTFKKPNHSSFSAESVYASPLHPGGVWTDGGFFTPSPATPNFYMPRDMASYMRDYEPGAALVGNPTVLGRLMYPDFN